MEKIPEESFIEAIINMQPYKPEFKTSHFAKSHDFRIAKQARRKLKRNKELEIPVETETTDSILKRTKV